MEKLKKNLTELEALFEKIAIGPEGMDEPIMRARGCLQGARAILNGLWPFLARINGWHD